ncbi:RNA polymerase sigma factor [Falsirhodobacter algicola]|uniref:RNA polymerase sigma factor n=1 Tax=Falsirhodobacter algicola TaxID=2692330 RepID=A0A8J8MQR8_9RHOB|nr:RNA polymerase sigma factor [Falsirhodobacter algicola]QUS34794.1 RNA polymerase sigma factor [Falsirhodobacter algicola]
MNMPLDTQPDIPDEALLVLYANGDAAAARSLTLRMVPRVLSYATRMLSDRAEAEDVAQEAMLRLWRIAPDWRQGEAKVSTWLYRVTTNLCTDRLRRRRRGVALDEAPETEDESPSVLADMMESDRMQALDAALARLPERQRQAVILRHIDGLANAQIGEIMGVRVEAVESLTARGKRGLAALLAGRKAELGYEDE